MGKSPEELSPKELQDAMLERLADKFTVALKEGIAAARKPDALQQKQLDDYEEQAQRKADLHFNMAMQEEMQKTTNLKGTCTHRRFPASAGKLGGERAPAGEGEWVTSGQLTGDDGGVIVCMRCGTTWEFEPSSYERDNYHAHGWINSAPPSPDRVEAYAKKKENKEHEQRAKFAAIRKKFEEAEHRRKLAKAGEAAAAAEATA